MKRFRFSLQSLLTLRQHDEQRALERFAATLASRQPAVARRDSARHHLERVRDDLRHEFTTGGVAAHIAHTHAYARVLEHELQQADQQLATADQAVANALKDMVAARRQREMIEGLRDRRFHQHARRSRRSEENSLNELASRRVPIGLISAKYT
jgi:flagellar FliJ protein